VRDPTNLFFHEIWPNYSVRSAIYQIGMFSRSPASGQTRFACVQCRRRRVKCDRNGECCNACTRLGFECSYSGPADESITITAAEADEATELTQAGTKRKRTLQACEQCRIQRAKCSGSIPCDRCLSKAQACTSARTTRRFLGVHQHQEAVVETPVPLTLPTPDTASCNATSPSSPITSMTVPTERGIIRRYIDAYFDRTNPGSLIFLHRPSILVDVSNGTINLALQTALCAWGLKISKVSPEYPEYQDHELPAVWMDKAQKAILGAIDKTSIEFVQTLVLIIEFHIGEGSIASAWNLMPIAVRMAFTLQLNYEHPRLSPIVQESRRRLMWSLYTFDRFSSGGVDDLILCPIDRMRIRLPCDEHSFRRGIPSRAEFLEHDRRQQLYLGIHMDIFAYHIRFLGIRHRILRYTKRVRREGICPSESKGELLGLQNELDTFYQGLPQDLALTKDQLLLMAHSSDACAYIILHVMWYQSHLDLYRFLVPGIRESVSRDAFERTPTEYIDFCQSVCIAFSAKLCKLWSQIAGIEGRESIRNMIFANSVYQVTQIVHQLYHLAESENTGQFLIDLKTGLEDGVKVAGLDLAQFARAAKVLKDTKRLLDRLDQDKRIISGTDSSSSDGENIQSNPHLASRHSLMPQGDRGSLEQTPNVNQPGQNESPLLPSIVAASESLLSLHSSLTSDVGTQMDLEMINNTEQQDGLLPWDPFELDLNDSYATGLADFSVL
jgi:hypothetical protein